MKLKRIVGTPWDAALAQPFIGSALPPMPGMPLGVNTRVGNPFIFDPFWAHRLDVVNSAVYLLTGNKGKGKSTLQKAIALRFGARRGRKLDSGEFAPIRMRFNDRKLEDVDPEYDKIVNYLEGEIVPLNRQASINVLDPKMNMTQTDMVETAVNICEMVSGLSPLPRLQGLALRIAVWKMLRDRSDETKPEILEAKLLGLTRQDVVDYYKQVNEYTEAVNVPDYMFQEDAVLVASYLGEVLHGSFGGVFGGDRSLRDVLSYNVVLLDWKGVSEKAQTLLSSMLWKWQEIAQRRGDHELIPDLLFNDEEHKAMSNLMYVRFMSANLKEARALRTAYFMSTQHETDLTMAGEPDSEIRRLSESVGLSIGGRFITEQPANKEVLDIYRQLGFSELDVNELTRMERGHFFFHATGQPAIPFRLDLTPIEEELVKSDSAVRSMTTDVMNGHSYN